MIVKLKQTIKSMVSSVSKRNRIFILILLLACVLAFFLFKKHLTVLMYATWQNSVYSIGSHTSEEIFTDDSSQDVLLTQQAGRRFAIMSSSLIDSRRFYYILYIPICALAWRRLGYEPILMFVKTKSSEHKDLADLTLNTLKFMNVTVIYVTAPDNYSIQVSMIARVFVGLLPDSLIGDNDLVVTTDTDLLPVNKEYLSMFNTNAIQILDSRNKQFIHDGKEYSLGEVQMSYIAMRKSQWRDVMRLSKQDQLNSDTIMKKTREIQGEDSFIENDKMQIGSDSWFLDQHTITIAINEYVKRNQGITKLIKFPYRGIRLDRGRPDLWHATLDQFDQITDAHMYNFNAFLLKSHVFSLLKRLFNKRIVEFLDDYFDRFHNVFLTY